MFTWTKESAAFWQDSAAYTKSYERLPNGRRPTLPPAAGSSRGAAAWGTCPSPSPGRAMP